MLEQSELAHAAAMYGVTRGEDRDWDRNEIRRRLREGSIRRLRRGVYAMRPADCRLEHRVIAALLMLPPGSVACGLTAARLWGLEGLPRETAAEPVHVALPAGERRALEGCRMHYGVPGPAWVVRGIPCVSVRTTILRTGAELAFEQALVIVEAALHARRVQQEELDDELRLRPPTRGKRQMQRVLAMASARSESPLESLARLAWLEAGIPLPEQQAEIWIADRVVGRVDFLWRAAGLIVEVDGYAKYANPGEAQREKARQNALISAGYTVLRFTWQDVVHRRESTVAAVRSALERSDPAAAGSQ